MLTKIIYFSHDHIEIMVNSAGELLFFRHREGPWMPTLRLFHKCKIHCCCHNYKCLIVCYFSSVLLTNGTG